MSLLFWSKKIVLFHTFILICCTSFANDNLFKQARTLQRDGKYDEAIEFIDSIRHAYPTAMNAREEGILLKDSIEIAKAEVELQTLMQQGITTGEDVEEAQRKIKYFVRKLSHDIEQRRTH